MITLSAKHGSPIRTQFDFERIEKAAAKRKRKAEKRAAAQEKKNAAV